MVYIQHFLRLVIIAGLSAWIITAGAAVPILDLAQYRGKVVYLDFWASWCAPCEQSFTWMNAMQAKYESHGLTIIAVNENKHRQNASKFLGQIPTHFKIVYDPEGVLAKQYGLVGLPSSFVIDSNGNVYRRHLGFSDGSSGEYEHEIRALLDK